MIRLRLAKAFFVLSIAVFGVAYGIAANQWGWFPSRLAKQAWHQAKVISTDKPLSYLVPRVYDRHGARVVQPEAMQPGVTLVSSMWKTQGDWEPSVRLLDRQGETVHRWRVNQGLFQNDGYFFQDDGYVHGTHLFPDGDLVANVEYVGTVRLDACGNVRWRLPKRTHHSVERATDGSFWLPAQMGKRTTDYSGFDEPVLPEQILHVSAEGEVLASIDLIDLLLQNDLERFIFRQHGPNPRGELMHLNDVEPLSASMADEYPLFETGDLLVSLRDVHLTFVFDPETRTVKWHASSPFTRQHDPGFIGDGRIGVFDNNPDGTPRGHVLGGSRIVVLHPSSDSTSILFPTDRSGPFYTEAGGKWQSLDDGNLLLTEAQAGRVVEVGPDGSAVWEYVRTPDRTQVPEILDGTRHSLTVEKVEAWGCSPGEGASEK